MNEACGTHRKLVVLLANQVSRSSSMGRRPRLALDSRREDLLAWLEWIDPHFRREPPRVPCRGCGGTGLEPERDFAVPCHRCGGELAHLPEDHVPLTLDEAWDLVENKLLHDVGE